MLLLFRTDKTTSRTPWKIRLSGFSQSAGEAIVSLSLLKNSNGIGAKLARLLEVKKEINRWNYINLYIYETKFQEHNINLVNNIRISFKNERISISFPYSF